MQTKLIRLRSPLAKHPIWCRPGGSDVAVFDQVIGRRSYASMDDLEDVGWVIDCGANIGASAAYFLSRFPRARVIGLESDPETFAVLEKNLEPYGDRAIGLRAAIWSSETGLVLEENPYRDGLEWSRQVRECRAGEAGTVEAVDVPAICRKFAIDRVSLLKMDVEGAEVVVFGEDPARWLDRVDAVALEIHDDSQFGPARGVVVGALVASGFEIKEAGELTIGRRRSKIL